MTSIERRFIVFCENRHRGSKRKYSMCLYKINFRKDFPPLTSSTVVDRETRTLNDDTGGLRDDHG